MTSAPTLAYLGQCYFHQDYLIEGDTPTDVVRAFARREAKSEVVALVGELTTFLSTGPTELVAWQLWMRDGKASYDPKSKGRSYVSWLAEMREVLVHELGIDAERIKDGRKP